MADSTTFSHKNFNRQYRLIAGQGGKTGFELGEVSAAYPVPLHITFSLQKSDLETQNTGKIEIWNLNKAHLAELEKPGCIVGLRAGYGNNMALIFSGFVSYVSTTMDGADRKTSIEVLDSLTAARDTYISLSYNGTVNWRTIFNDVAAKMGVAVVYSYNAQFTNVSNGYSYMGLAKNVLTKGCNCCGLSWSIQNGVLQIKKSGDAISKQGYLISAETGMIKMPERVVITDEKISDSNIIGYDVTYFLNGAINIDDYVKLESEVVSGYFYVYSLEINGDNLKGDWTCKARLLELTNNAKSSSSAASDTETSESDTTPESGGTTYNVGDKVRVVKGAKTYTGGGLASFVYTTVYDVLQVDGDRVVIGLDGVVTAAVNAKDLYTA